MGADECARLAVTEILKHARQDGGKHVAVDGAWTVIRGELTPGGDAGTCGQPVRGLSPESRYASQKIHKTMTSMNAMANTGRVSSVHASMPPLTSRNMIMERIRANTHTIAPARTTRWLSSSDRRSNRCVCRLSHTPVLDDSNLFHTSMTLRRLSAFSSSRSYEPSFQYRAIPFLLRDCFSLEGLVSRRFSQLDVSNTSAHMGPATGSIMRGCSCPMRQMP